MVKHTYTGSGSWRGERISSSNSFSSDALAARAAIAKTEVERALPHGQQPAGQTGGGGVKVVEMVGTGVEVVRAGVVGSDGSGAHVGQVVSGVGVVGIGVVGSVGSGAHVGHVVSVG